MEHDHPPGSATASTPPSKHQSPTGFGWDGTTGTLPRCRHPAASLTQRNSRLLQQPGPSPARPLPVPASSLARIEPRGPRSSSGLAALAAHVLVCTPGSKQPAANSPRQQPRLQGLCPIPKGFAATQQSRGSPEAKPSHRKDKAPPPPKQGCTRTEPGTPSPAPHRQRGPQAGASRP